MIYLIKDRFRYKLASLLKPIIWQLMRSFTCLVYSQLAKTYYMATDEIIYVYFSHMTYLMSHVTSLNNICGWFYKLPRNGL